MDCVEKFGKVAVLGLGRSGVSALGLASRLGLEAEGFDEKKLPPAGSAVEGAKMEIWSGSPFSGFGTIVTSPGISERSEMMKAALSSGIRIIGELEFASIFCRVPVIALTGTNGKTTTTELVSHLLNAVGKKSVCAGNIGTPLSDFAGFPSEYDFIVAEVSSFQLEKTSEFSPAAAAVLNIESDHMDRYAGIDEYARVKFGIFRNVGAYRSAVIRSDLLGFWRRFSGRGDLPITFSLSDSSADFHMRGQAGFFRMADGDGISFDFSRAHLRGAHNYENMMAALALALCAFPEADAEILEAAVCGFRGAEHRIELFAEKDGIRFVNDSKGTNPDAVRAALRAFGGSGNVCLIAGGLDKNMDFSPLVEEISRVKSVFLVGECKNKLFHLLKDIAKCTIYDSFEKAVLAACGEAERGDVVMLSPGCASMDMFKDYRERGNIFKETVKRRLEK